MPPGGTHPSLWWRIIQAVEAKVNAMAIPGIDDRVYVMKVPGKRAGDNRFYPACFISPERDAYPADRGTTARDWVTYGVQLHLVMADREAELLNIDLELYWRELLSDNFRHQRLPGVPEVYDCVVEHGTVFGQTRFFGPGLSVAGLVLRFRAVKTRSYTVTA